MSEQIKNDHEFLELFDSSVLSAMLKEDHFLPKANEKIQGAYRLIIRNKFSLKNGKDLYEWATKKEQKIIKMIFFQHST